MDSNPLWLWIEELFSGLDRHPLAQAVLSLGLLLIVALVLGRVARFLLLHAMKLLGLGALLNALLDIYARTEHARTRSIKGYVQLAKMILYIFGRNHRGRHPD
jgi:miniconductance mechanosensitive channel